MRHGGSNAPRAGEFPQRHPGALQGLQRRPALFGRIMPARPAALIAGIGTVHQRRRPARVEAHHPLRQRRHRDRVPSAVLRDRLPAPAVALDQPEALFRRAAKPTLASCLPDHLLASIGPPGPARGRGLGGDGRGPEGDANSETIALSATVRLVKGRGRKEQRRRRAALSRATDCGRHELGAESSSQGALGGVTPCGAWG